MVKNKSYITVIVFTALHSSTYLNDLCVPPDSTQNPLRKISYSIFKFFRDVKTPKPHIQL